MKILIVDDEALARSRLRSLLEDIGDFEIVGEAGNGRQALEMCQQQVPDTVLLDIRMPGMDGLETAAHLAGLELPPAVIFTTAYEDHTLEAFRLHALDYLLKPVRRERLQAALSHPRLLTRRQLRQLQQAAPGGGRRTHISVRLRHRLELVPVAEIAYFQAGQKYVTLFHQGRELLIDEPLKSLEEEFAELFLRVHRNALVARHYLSGLQQAGEGRYLVMVNGVPDGLDISRRHLADVRRALKEKETGTTG